jgi:hypothetical protein
MQIKFKKLKCSLTDILPIRFRTFIFLKSEEIASSTVELIIRAGHWKPVNGSRVEALIWSNRAFNKSADWCEMRYIFF